MSHFTVAVFSDGNKTVEELLAPYQENSMGDCPKEYMEFNEIGEEEYTEYLEEYEEHRNEYENFDTFMKEYEGYEKDETTGKYGYLENPNAKWDWYQIGGRWSGNLKLKDGATSGELREKSWANASEVIPEDRVDSAKIKDIDFSLDIDRYNKAIRFWELIVDGDTPKNDKEIDDVKWNFYKPEYYNNRYKSKEQYAQLAAEFDTYAVINPDGVWHSKGDMGWWGCSSESAEEANNWSVNFKEKFIDNANPEWTLTVVDCHI